MIEWVVSSSVLILVVILLRTLLRGKISLRLQYALWALVLVRLLLPVNFGGTALSIMNTAQRVPVVQDMETLHGFDNIEHMQGGTVEGYAATDYMPDRPTTIAENKSDAEFTRMKMVLTVRELLLPAWKLGILVMLAVFGLSNLRFRGELNRRRTRLERADYPLPVYVTDAVETPCLFGLVHPAVYLTPEVQENPTTMRHALAHELTHFRHGDHIWAILRCACLALHWYNPLVWAAATLSRRDAELSCDEGTIRRIGESERIEYGKTLIDLTCTKREPSALFCTATTMTSSKKSIYERVTRMAKAPKMLGATVAAVILATALAVGCTFTGAQKPSENTPVESEAAVPLSEEELAYFNDEFFNGEDFNLHNQFLTSLYDTPEDIDLFELFYCGTGQQEDISDAELQMVGAIDENGEEICPTDKLPVSALDAVLTENMGLMLAKTNQIGLEYLDYHKEYNAYYHTHGDTNYYFFAVFTAGARQGDLLSLVYEDGNKVVTLRETKDGGYQFVSNRYNAAPAVTEVTVPDEESLLCVKLGELPPYALERVETEAFTRQEWGELMDTLLYQGAGAEPNHDILVGHWPGDGICACYADYDSAGERSYHRFVQLCTEDSAQYVLENPDWVSIAPFTDLFGYDGFVITSDGLSRYYFFDKDGGLNLLYSTYGKLDQLFTVGEACIYAFDDAGHAHDPAMLIQKDGQLYRAELAELLARLVPKAGYPWLDVSLSNGVGLLCYSDTSSEQIPLCSRLVCCDGEALLFYTGDGKTYASHLADGIDVPEEVVRETERIAGAELEYIQREYPEKSYIQNEIQQVHHVHTCADVEGETFEVYAVDCLYRRVETDNWEKFELGPKSYLIFRKTADGRLQWLEDFQENNDPGTTIFTDHLHESLMDLDDAFLYKLQANASLEIALEHTLTERMMRILPGDYYTFQWKPLDTTTSDGSGTMYGVLLFFSRSGSPLIYSEKTGRYTAAIFSSYLLPVAVSYQHDRSERYVVTDVWEPSQENYEEDVRVRFSKEDAEDILQNLNTYAAALLAADGYTPDAAEMKAILEGPIWPAYHFNEELDDDVLCGLADYYGDADIYTKPVRDELYTRFFQHPQRLLNALGDCEKEVQNTICQLLSEQSRDSQFPKSGVKGLTPKGEEVYTEILKIAKIL